jgi:prefoldin subunit 5
MKDKGGRQVPNCVPNESVVNETPKKLKHTISKKEWSKIPKYNKHIGMDGVHYIMKYDDKIGTYLQGVQIVDESVNEAPNTGEKIQNLNNRIKALKDKMAATKSSEQKNLIQQRLKNALQTLSNYKKQNVSKESIVKEATYNFGKEEYTKKNLTPTQIQDLAFGYVQTPITKLVGKTLGHRVNLANDLAKLTGTKQLDAKARGKEPALIMVLLKNKLVSKEEYIQMYKDLIEKHQQVIKYLRNASPEMRNTGGAARAAAKDMKGEFDMD